MQVKFVFGSPKFVFTKKDFNYRLMAMSRPKDSLDIRLMSKVSSLYYHQDYKQQEIADRLHLSRPKVSRLLKQARNQGIIQISVLSPDGNFVDLESKLEQKFGLDEVLIVENESSVKEKNSILKKQLGVAAANYLHRTISDNDVLGVTWGTTLQAMVEAVQPMPTNNVQVVQMLGGVGPPEAKAHAADISRRLSQLLDTKLTLLPAPGIVGNPEAKEVLLSEKQVRNPINLFKKITTAYVGIGALSTNPVLKDENAEIPSSIYKELIDSGAVGDVSLLFFNEKGEEIDTSLNELLIGISISQLKAINTVVGIAGGADKVRAINGALRGNFIDVLITDIRTGKNLLK